MPELPDVETIVRQLDGVLSGKKICKVEVIRTKSFQGNGNDLVEMVVDGVGRKAKMIVINFRNWDKVLIVHLKMTGQLIYLSGNHRVVGGHPTADWVNELPSKYTRIIIDFDNGAKLFFNDLRVFGWMRVMTNDEWRIVNDKLPPDVVDREFTLEYFKRALAKSGRRVKLVLLDQVKFF